MNKLNLLSKAEMKKVMGGGDLDDPSQCYGHYGSGAECIMCCQRFGMLLPRCEMLCDINYTT